MIAEVITEKLFRAKIIASSKDGIALCAVGFYCYIFPYNYSVVRLIIFKIIIIFVCYHFVVKSGRHRSCHYLCYYYYPAIIS
jgi:hypothetical protein